MERPILMSGAMVRATLDGTKTMTRRVMRRQPESTGTLLTTPLGKLWYVWPHEQEQGVWVEHLCACPYGRPGARLWVRETWALNFGQLLYRTDCHPDSFEYGTKGWKPSIHMPRWASRLLLEIVSIRVEQAQDISAQDIEAEGTPHNPMNQASYRNDPHQRLKDFTYLWDIINAKRGYSWESNPWVWAITFKKLELTNG